MVSTVRQGAVLGLNPYHLVLLRTSDSWVPLFSVAEVSILFYHSVEIEAPKAGIYVQGMCPKLDPGSGQCQCRVASGKGAVARP